MSRPRPAHIHRIKLDEPDGGPRAWGRCCCGFEHEYWVAGPPDDGDWNGKGKLLANAGPIAERGLLLTKGSAS